MRLRKILMMFSILVYIALPACSKPPTLVPVTPTQASEPISIPDISKPATTPQETTVTPTETVSPPTEATQTAYPPPNTPEEQQTPYPAPMEGEALLNERCTKCHNLDRVKSAKKTADGWKANVDRMSKKGAQLSPEEASILVQYLAETFK